MNSEFPRSFHNGGSQLRSNGMQQPGTQVPGTRDRRSFQSRSDDRRPGAKPHLSSLRDFRSCRLANLGLASQAIAYHRSATSTFEHHSRVRCNPTSQRLPNEGVYRFQSPSVPNDGAQFPTNPNGGSQLRSNGMQQPGRKSQVHAIADHSSREATTGVPARHHACHRSATSDRAALPTWDSRPRLSPIVALRLARSSPKPVVAYANLR